MADERLPKPTLLFYALTPRQQEIAKLLSGGELTTDKELATALGEELRTVENAVADMFDRMKSMGYLRPRSKIELLRLMFEWPRSSIKS